MTMSTSGHDNDPIDELEMVDSTTIRAQQSNADMRC